jgi:hypothetical protein
MVLPLPLFHLENHVCLSRGVQVASVKWWVVTRIVLGVEDLVQRTGDSRTGRVLGGAVCDLHRARGDEKRGFLGSASKPRSIVCQWFGLKTTGTVCY